MSDALRLGVVLSAAWAGGVLAAQWIRTRSWGRRVWFASPAGRPGRGIAWALGAGLSPMAKESGREHLPVYLLGVTYHAGLLASLLILLGSVQGAFPGREIPAAAGWPSLVGALAGTALLARRVADRQLRAISCPDDFLANALATGFALLAGLRAMMPVTEPGLGVAAILLFVYAPLGKIRHCLFFFATRAHMGAWFGRRGVLPPTA